VSVISTFYSKQGQLLGMPIIVESGLCSDDDSTRNTLTRYETQRVQLVSVRRRTGIIAKSLDGQTIRTTTVRDSQVGTFSNCMQIGRTRFSFVAPKQLFSPFQGRKILSYERTWLQLEE
jgi:hypothetical protein